MLSYFMVVKDAERLLPAAIANARRFADEVLVIVDDTTTDASGTVARRLADRAECWPVGGSYESVLNEAAALCAGDWVLYGHDDELWTPAFRAKLPELLAGFATEDAPEYLFTRRHVVTAADGACRWIIDAPLWPDWQLRLRSRAAWQARPWPRRVHATPEQRPGWHYVHAPIWHLKFAVKSAELRAARLAGWEQLWTVAGNAHYRLFSLPEEAELRTAALDEAAPEELAAMLSAAAGKETA